MESKERRRHQEVFMILHSRPEREVHVLVMPARMAGI
jgi:hypothetical protein